MSCVFVSVFASKLEAMLEYRAARGFKRESYLPYLVKFDKYCESRFCETPHLTADLVYNWLESENIRDISAKATVIRQFGKYLCAVDDEAYVLPEKSTPHTRAKVPYVFTDDEITALFLSIDNLRGTRNEPYFSEMVPVLFRLTYTCGLRPNESRELLYENVNFTSGEILITNTKRNKERIVVMSDSMRDLCYEYNLRRNIFGRGNPYLFPSSQGAALSNAMVNAAFNKAWREAGRACGNLLTEKVRVYNLRHQFASVRLNLWLNEGENLMAMLPYLRAYMGHTTMNETAYYIHILPENLVKSSAID
jgi:Site-specific recombinase XerD